MQHSYQRPLLFISPIVICDAIRSGFINYWHVSRSIIKTIKFYSAINYVLVSTSFVITITNYLAPHQVVSTSFIKSINYYSATHQVVFAQMLLHR